MRELGATSLPEITDSLASNGSYQIENEEDYYKYKEKRLIFGDRNFWQKDEEKYIKEESIQDFIKAEFTPYIEMMLFRFFYKDYYFYDPDSKQQKMSNINNIIVFNDDNDNQYKENLNDLFTQQYEWHRKKYLKENPNAIFADFIKSIIDKYTKVDQKIIGQVKKHIGKIEEIVGITDGNLIYNNKGKEIYWHNDKGAVYIKRQNELTEYEREKINLINEMVKKNVAKSLNEITILDDYTYKMPAVSADDKTFLPLTYSEYFNGLQINKEDIDNLNINLQSISSGEIIADGVYYKFTPNKSYSVEEKAKIRLRPDIEQIIFKFIQSDNIDNNTLFNYRTKNMEFIDIESIHIWKNQKQGFENQNAEDEKNVYYMFGQTCKILLKEGINIEKLEDIVNQILGEYKGVDNLENTKKKLLEYVGKIQEKLPKNNK